MIDTIKKKQRYLLCASARIKTEMAEIFFKIYKLFPKKVYLPTNSKKLNNSQNFLIVLIWKWMAITLGQWKNGAAPPSGG